MSTQQILAAPEAPVTALTLKKRVQELDSQIKRFSQLASVEDYSVVAEYGLAAARIVKEAEAFYAEEVANLYSMWKAKTAERGTITGPAEAIKNLAARFCGEWQKVQERKRREEELRQQELERQRAETAVLEEAAQLERDGRADDAQALIEAPVVMAPVAVPTAVPQIKGVSAPRVTWKAEVTSLALLIKAVADGKVPVQAIQADEKFLNKMATALKGELKYPGVKVTSSAKASYRG